MELSQIFKSLFNRFKIDRRPLKRRILSLLPKPIRFRVMREMLNIRYDTPLDITFKNAETKEELEQAYKILHDNYVECSFMKPHHSGMRLTKYFILPSTTTLIISIKGKVVGTLSIIVRTALGLPMESRYNLSEHMDPDELVAEVSALAIDKSYLGGKAALFLPICKYFYKYIRNYMGIHKVFIAVNPSMADFYEGFLFFDRLKENVQDKYDFANGAPAVGLVGDFDKIFKTMEKEYNSKKSNKNLFAFFILKESTQFKFPIRDFYKTMDPIMTPDLIEHFFVHKSDVLAQLSPNELLYLSQLYPYNIIKNIKPLSLYSHKKIKFRNSRFLSSINCSIINDKYKVFDLSLFGLRVGGKKPLNISDEILINVEIAHNRNLTLIGIIKWIDKNNNQYGVELKKTVSQSWLEYVKYIESDFFKLQTSEYKAA